MNRSINSVEIRFERLAEEFAPPPPKPEPVEPGRRHYVSQPSDIPRAQGITRKSYPLTSIWVTLAVTDEDTRSGNGTEFSASIYRQLAMQLADELMKRMEVRKDYDVAINATRYSALLMIADPKVIGSSVEEYAMMRGL